MERLIETEILIMWPDEPNETRIFELPEQPSYQELREVVRIVLGSQDMDIEHVTVLADFAGGLAFKRADMFVDEMGHPKGLPRNENATVIYRRNALLNQGVRDPETLDWIAGPAALFQRIVWT